MINEFKNIIFQALDKNAVIPYDLLLLADPSKEMIDAYLQQSNVYTASYNGDLLGLIVLFPLTEETLEIKNIAVKPEFQGLGIGTYLIESAIKLAILGKKKAICIGTANSSIAQLNLYQKLGFEVTEILKDFFIKNYAEVIYENGIQAKDMLVLTKQLTTNF